MDDKVIRLRKAVLEEADKMRRADAEELDAKKEEILKTFRAKKEREEADFLASKSAEIKSRAREEMSALAMAETRKLLLERENMCDKLFSRVREELRAFTEEEAYAEWMKERLEKVISEYPDEKISITLCRNEDIALVQNMGKEAEVTQEDFIGGFRALLEGRHIALDETLAARLQELRNDFHAIEIPAEVTG